MAARRTRGAGLTRPAVDGPAAIWAVASAVSATESHRLHNSPRFPGTSANFDDVVAVRIATTGGGVHASHPTPHGADPPVGLPVNTRLATSFVIPLCLRVTFGTSLKTTVCPSLD